MANLNSIISYVPQPYHIAGASTIVAQSGVSSIENTAGIFDPDLSNFTTVVPNVSTSSFGVKIDFAKKSAHLAAFNMSLGLIGCALLTYEDSFGSPNLSTEFSENINCTLSSNVGAVAGVLASVAHNSQDNIRTFGGGAMPSIISGGRSNLLFNGLGVSSAGATATIYVTVTRSATNVAARPHARFVIGHLFVGVDMSVIIDPNTFSWTLEVENERFTARDFGAISSDGTLVKRSAGEIIKISNEKLIGMTVTGVSPVAEGNNTNFFDLVKVNTSYPLLFNPYPVGPIVASSLTVEEANLTARENFFSLYGFMSDPVELLVGDYRQGLSTEYRARYRIVETR